MISRTGYEFCQISLEELTKDKLKDVQENIGLVCEKCGSNKSNKWYIEKLMNNYLPDYRLICEKCK